MPSRHQLMGSFDMATNCVAISAGGAAEAKCRAEQESSRSHAQKLAEEKMALLVKVEQERANSADYKASCPLAVFPCFLHLAAMSTLESQEVKQSFGDVVKCALARVANEEALVAAIEAMKLLKLPHIAQLERDQDYPIGVIMAGLTLVRHATEGAETSPDYFLKPDVAQLQVPIFASPRDILNPFALEKEIPLKESYKAPSQKGLLRKKGWKGNANNIDSELLGKLEEAGNAAYQVGSSERSRCHNKRERSVPFVSTPQEPFVFNQDPGVNSSQSPLQSNHDCCFECGDSLDGIFCQRCTCKSCGNGAHIGYNCPPKASIISNPEPCNQIIDKFPQTLPSVHPTCNSRDENSFTHDSKPNFVDSPNVFNPLPQPSINSCEFYRNNARYGHYCTPQVPFIYPETCDNQDFNFPQDFHDFQQHYLCCENCGSLHETFQCQPMNEDSYEQNSCYDPNSFGFDHFQPLQYTINHPILNAQNEFLNSQNKLMEQMTSICDMIPICYDDDEDYTITITPVLSTKEPVDSLIMEDEHLSTSVENLVQIPSEFKGISEDTCDVPVCEDPSTFDALSNHSEILSDSNNDGTSSDDDSYENIEYVEASPLNLEYDRLEEVHDEDQEEKEFDLVDIFQIQDVILREKLLNISRLITNIESLKNNPTPDHVLKSC
ncbi:hypothetical protein Tco_0174443 [Tanacetum coccineum]